MKDSGKAKERLNTFREEADKRYEYQSYPRVLCCYIGLLAAAYMFRTRGQIASKQTWESFLEAEKNRTDDFRLPDSAQKYQSFITFCAPLCGVLYDYLFEDGGLSVVFERVDKELSG